MSSWTLLTLRVDRMIPGSPLDDLTRAELDTAIARYTRRTRRDRTDFFLYLSAHTLTRPLTSLDYDVLPTDILSLYLHNSLIVELDCARLPKTLVNLDVSFCKHLKRILNLDHLPALTNLSAWGVPIRALPRLPSTLKYLEISDCTDLTSLPCLLHTSLLALYMDGTHIEVLPPLPETLLRFSAERGAIRSDPLPDFPDSLSWLSLKDSNLVTSGFIPARPSTMNYDEYAPIVRALLRKKRLDRIREELMMVAWHPDRVSKWLEAGEHVLDMMMGC